MKALKDWLETYRRKEFWLSVASACVFLAVFFYVCLLVYVATFNNWLATGLFWAALILLFLGISYYNPEQRC